MSIDDSHLPIVLPAVAAGPISEAPIATVPWDRNEGGWLSRWWETVLAAMLRPSELFAAVRNGGRLDRAILFFVIGLLLEAVIAPMTAGQSERSMARRLVETLPRPEGLSGLNLDGDLNLVNLLPDVKAIQAGVHAPPGRSLVPQQPPRPAAQLVPHLGNVLWPLSYVLSFVLGFAGLFVTAAVFQAGAWVFVPRRRPFRDTLRTVAYAHAPLVWTLVPVVGEVVFAVWLSVLLVVGLRVVHGTTKTRVVAALSLWPTVAMLTLAATCIVLIQQISTGASGRLSW